MNRWKGYWNRYPATVEETGYLRQVGKTVHGQPISKVQFQSIVSDIIRRLNICLDDHVLDLCCGNGLITKEVARVSRSVVGVDYSRPLIRIARRSHQGENVHYIESDVLDLTPEMVGAHPLVCSTVEPTLFSNYTAPWIRSWNYEAANIEQGRWYQGLPFFWDEEDFYAFLREFVNRVYDQVVATSPEATYILDKHPGYAKYVDDINRLVPNARFIHIIRDGRDVAASMVAARRAIGYGTETIPASAAVWKEHVLAAWEARKYEGQYLEVRYEDLLTSGAETLKAVFDFCGLPANEDEISGIIEAHQFERMKERRQSPDYRVKSHKAFYRKGKAGSWREELLPIERYRFDRIAGELLCELGYAEAGWWAESRSEKLTLPILHRMSAAGWRIRRATAVLTTSHSDL